MANGLGGGFARPLRRLSILVDVQDQATAQMAALNGAGMKLGNTFNGTAAAGRNMKMALAGATAATAVMALAMRRITRMGAQLDSTFATIRATANATQQEMQGIINATQEIGATMPVTLNEVTQAFRAFSFAGFTAEQSIRAADDAVELAVAGQLEMQMAVETTTKLMNAYNIEAENAGQITEVIGNTFANHALEVEELGNAMSYVSATASSLGMSIAETSSAIGVLADVGIGGTKAGTRLNQMLNALVNPTKKASDALNAVGLAASDFSDEEGNMLSMVEIFEKIDEHTKHLSEQEAASWWGDIAGRRGAIAGLGLIDKVDDLDEAVNDRMLVSIRAAVEGFEELDEVAKAKRAIRLEHDDLDYVNEQFDSLSDEEIIEWAVELDADPGDLDVGNVRDVVTEANEMLADGMDEAAVADHFQHLLDVEEDMADRFVDRLAEEGDVDALVEQIQEATGASDIATEQMAELGGKLEYLRGSFSAVAYELYKGFHPAVMLLADAMIAWADLLNDYPAVLKAIGAAMAVLTTIMATFLGMMLKTIAATWAASAAGAAKAAVVHGLVAAYGGYTAGLIHYVWAEKGAIAATKVATMTTLGKMKAVMAARVAEYGYLGAIVVTTKALFVKAAALTAVTVAANPLMWVVIAMTAAVVAYKNNLLGFKDVVDGVIDRIKAFTGSLAFLKQAADMVFGAFKSKMIERFHTALEKLRGLIGDALPDNFDKLTEKAMTLLNPMDEIEERVDTILGLFKAIGRHLPSLDLNIEGGENLSRLEKTVRLLRGAWEWAEKTEAKLEGWYDKIDPDNAPVLFDLPAALQGTYKWLSSLQDLPLGKNWFEGFWDDLMPDAPVLFDLPAHIERSMEGVDNLGLSGFEEFWNNLIPQPEDIPVLIDVPEILGDIYDWLDDIESDLEDWWDSVIPDPGDIDPIIDLGDGLDDISDFNLTGLEQWWNDLIPQPEEIDPIIDLGAKFNDLKETLNDIANMSPSDVWSALDFDIPNWLKKLLDRFTGGQTGGWGVDPEEESGGDETDRGGSGEGSRSGPGDDHETERGSRSNNLSNVQKGRQTLQNLSYSPQTGTRTAGGSGGTEIDARKVVVEQSPSIQIESSGAGGVSPDDVQKQVERGMDQARVHALEDFYDFLTLGSPDRFQGGTTTGGEQEEADDDLFGEDGQQDDGTSTDGEDGEDTTESGGDEPSDGETML